MTAYENLRVVPLEDKGGVFEFWVVADRGTDRVILARSGWVPGSACHPHTETEAKCWADLFAQALPMLRLIQELARRVEAGEIRSKRTYAAIKDILSKIGDKDTSLPAETLGGAVGRLGGE